MIAHRFGSLNPSVPAFLAETGHRHASLQVVDDLQACVFRTIVAAGAAGSIAIRLLLDQLPARRAEAARRKEAAAIAGRRVPGRFAR